LDLGLEMAGWHVAYATDHDTQAIKTLRTNAGLPIGRRRKAFNGAFIEQADVRNLTAGDILAKAGLRKGEVPLLAGGPPCQSWSSAGHQLGFDDPRGQLFDDFVRIANGLDVRWLLLENVRGLLTARGPDGRPGSALGHIRRRLLDAGFQTTVELLNAADFGVPQRRVRLFMIGFRAGDTPHFPEPTHAKAPELRLKEWVPLSRALAQAKGLKAAEIIRPTAKLAEELANILPGSGVKSPGKSERTRPGGHWGYKQGAFVANPSQPARTVTASTAQDWIKDARHGLRRLCPRECAAIQTFPPEWNFDGNAQSQYRLIGNAVPPSLAKAIGESLLADFRRRGEDAEAAKLDRLLPLSARLIYHVEYTAREDASNGQSRRAAPNKRAVRVALGA
jgi:DNA (cytosine-5)-methyltransferase 1